LRFVTTILEPHGWTCKISDSAASTKFEVFRGNMRGASTARPHTSFSGDADSRKITIYTATQTQVVPKVTCLLTELTEEAVTKHVLEFFEKLASEPSDAGALPTTRRARRDWAARRPPGRTGTNSRRRIALRANNGSEGTAAGRCIGDVRSRISSACLAFVESSASLVAPQGPFLP